MKNESRLLRAAFLVGAATDAGAFVPMLHARTAGLTWGIERTGWEYDFAMRMGASLMAAWTVLLAWAARKPTERKAVAPMTVLVIAGFVAAEAAALKSGDLAPAKALPIFVMQAALSALFLVAYRRAGAGRAGLTSPGRP